ncbi:MAG: hypothetical protein H0U75_12660 [Legionella sp.]|nr:hypothetical protein [Legionella sp.]
MSDYWFNPIVHSDKLHTFDKPHYFYWFFQCLVGGAGYFDSLFKGQDESFFANLKYITRRGIIDYDSPLVHMGILDYLLVIPFINQLGFVIFIKSMDAIVNLDGEITGPKFLLASLIGFLGSVCLMLHILGSVVLVPIKFILAGALLLVGAPFLLRHYRHVQQQELNMMQTPVLYVKGHRALSGPQNDLSDELLEALLDESGGKWEVTLQDALRNTNTHVKPSISPMRNDSRALGVFMEGHLIALILPSKRTKEGILAMLSSNSDSLSKRSLDIKRIKSLLDTPHWQDARTAHGFFAFRGAIQQYSANTELASVAGGVVPDVLFAEISKFAGLNKVSPNIAQANAAFFSKHRAAVSCKIVVEDYVAPTGLVCT